MLGCLARIGCLAVLAVAAIGGWLWYTDQLPFGLGRDAAPAVAAGASTWQPITDAGAARARRQVESLGGPAGPVFVNVAPGDLASYVFSELAKQLPPSTRDVQVAAIGDRVYMKGVVSLAELGGRDVLGPFAAMLGDRDTLQLGGDFQVLRPGLAQFTVREVKLREFRVPQPVIPRIVSQIRRGDEVVGLAPAGLALQVPEHIGDVRVADGQVTLYKSRP